MFKGKLVEGQKLLIKYPDNPNTSILNNNPQKIQTKSESTSAATTVTNCAAVNNVKNNSTTTATVIKLTINNKAIINNNNNNNNDTIILAKPNNNINNTNNNNNSNDSKLTGPVNGNECYFWRTTGCVYADKCRYLHLSKSKGIDKKPWHKAPI